jgi:hypothetical protein
MRKPGLSSLFITLALATGILVLLLSFTGKAMNDTCSVDVNCPEEVENVKGGELLWESLSRQFVGSVSAY